MAISMVTPSGDAPQFDFDALTRARLVAERSPLACIISSAATHAVQFANRAACEALGSEMMARAGLPLHRRFREAADVERLLDRAATTLVTQVRADLQYVHPIDGLRRCTLIVAPIIDASIRVCGLQSQLLPEGPAADTLALIQELKAANERLLVASVREQALADEALRREAAMKALLARESVRGQASAELGATLGYQETLQHIARLPLPKLADYCVVHALERTKVTGIACAHHDFKHEALLQEASAKRASLSMHGVGYVLRTEQSASYPEVESAAWLARGLGFASTEVFEELGAAALVCLPLRARDQLLGVMSVIRTASSLAFSDDEMALFEELAQRASVALDNAVLYQNAQTALRQRDDVLAVVSHDLRSPLSTIVLSAGILLEAARAGNPGDTRRPLELILRTSRHMLGMINELLDLAGIHAQKLTLHAARTDVAKLVDEVLQMLQTSAEQKPVRLVRRVSASTAYAWCDAERVLRTLTNLVGNAIKFTPPSGTVVVSLTDKTNELEIEVADNGPGVSQENLDKLFEPYWSGARASSSGTGLGLYIARGIVQAHGGRMWVESTPGTGSAFRFTLPKQASN